MKLINGECLEEMDKLIAEWIKVDSIIADPPYWTIKGIGWEWIKHWMQWKTEWDIIITPEDIFKRANLLLRKNGKLILFSQEPYTSKLITEAIHNIQFWYKMTWVKDHFANSLIAKKAPVSYTEDILVFSKNYETESIHPLRPYFKKVMQFIWLNLKKINTALWHRRAEHTFYIDSTQYCLCTEKTYLELIEVFWIDKMEWLKEFEELKEIDNKYKKEFESVFNLPEWKKYKSNILEYKKDYNWYHPTQKPVALMEDLVTTYTNEWETVLDFTMWSGSTWVWAVNTNRKFIWIEVDEAYFKIAKERIQD